MDDRGAVNKLFINLDIALLLDTCVDMLSAQPEQFSSASGIPSYNSNTRVPPKGVAYVLGSL